MYQLVASTCGTSCTNSAFVFPISRPLDDDGKNETDATKSNAHRSGALCVIICLFALREVSVLTELDLGHLYSKWTQRSQMLTEVERCALSFDIFAMIPYG